MYLSPSTINKKRSNTKQLENILPSRGRGATGSRGSIDPPLFQVRGPPMVLDPALLSGSLAIITAHTA